jgi:maltose/moltooligosaccharide transporter
MAQKPQLSFWQIWNMSFGFLGIQFGFALQNANVSRIFETLGGGVEKLSVYWLAAPLTGLIIQPIIGHMSDKTWNRLGRRKPYFLVGAILASIALLFMPYSPTLWVAVGMLWILDASINISMEPFRAFVGDMLPPSQRTTGFAMQSFFIGTGAVVASALPYIMSKWLNISNVAEDGGIALSVKVSFVLGAIVFFSAVLYTVLSTKEYSPEELESFEKDGKFEKKPSAEPGMGSKAGKKINPFIIGIVMLVVGAIILLPLLSAGVDGEVLILPVGLMAFGVFEMLAGWMQQNKMENGLTEIVTDLNAMPKTMKQLALVQFFSWFALFSMWIYTTSAVTSSKYDMVLDDSIVAELQAASDNAGTVPGTEEWATFDQVKKELQGFQERFDDGKQVNASMSVVKFFVDDKKRDVLSLGQSTLARLQTIQKNYNDGADWVGVLMAVYNGFAAVMAFVLIALARRFSRKTVHAISLLVGGVSFISFFFISNPDMLMIPELGIGLAWASILAMPYAILTGSIPSNKMGVYMGIFNFFIVIPQIVAASILGFLLKTFFDGNSIMALVIGGVSLIIAAAMVIFVEDKN